MLPWQLRRKINFRILGFELEAERFISSELSIQKPLKNREVIFCVILISKATSFILGQPQWLYFHFYNLFQSGHRASVQFGGHGRQCLVRGLPK